MPAKLDANTALQAGVAYLARQQAVDGSFTMFSSPSRKPFRPALTYRTCFGPALILSALAAGDVPGAGRVRERLAAWLIMQAGPQWSFNYWVKQAPQHQQQPYPDDLDDTFCALSALYLHDPVLVNQQALASAVKLLLATETRVGGPYRTWLVPAGGPAAWQDIDLAVNANVAYFLSLTAQPLPALNSLMEQAIAERAFVSPYYPSAYPVMYYIARAYQGPQQAALAKIVRRLARQADTVQDTAVSIASLVRVGELDAAARLTQTLLAMQAKDGSWPAGAFCLDPALDQQTYYSGSSALTTAFALEALQLATRQQMTTSPVKRRSRAVATERQTQVLALAERQSQALGPELRTSLRQALRSIAQGSNGDEIIDLAKRFNASLAQPLTGARRLLTHLSLANLYGWLAYTIYDDFLDEEGQPRQLSVANAAMRRSLSNWHQALPDDPGFAKVVAETFDSIDAANAWELAHCRLTVTGKTLAVEQLPDYGNLTKLAERSLGHTLGPLAVLRASGAGGSPALRRALTHYLIARQLNDDCHDWANDLAKGHCTYVVARLLADLGVTSGSHRLTPLRAKARQQFWRVTLPNICQEMQQQLRFGRAELAKVKALRPDNVVCQLLDRVEHSVSDTLAQQQQSLNFLQQYRSGTIQP